jgi:hypothetical protein
MLHAWLVASPLHWPRIKNRRVGDIVALIDAALTQARRVGSNPAITPAPVTAAAAAPSGGAAFSSTDGAAWRPADSRRVDHAPELRLLCFPPARLALPCDKLDEGRDRQAERKLQESHLDP